MDEFHGPRDKKTGRYGEWFNPNSQYDWYQLGGRFTGHLVLKPGRKGLLGSPGVCTAPAGPGRADQARKGDIDFAAMSRERFARFLEAWSELKRTGKTLDRHAKWDHGIPETVTTREESRRIRRGSVPSATHPRHSSRAASGPGPGGYTSRGHE